MRAASPDELYLEFQDTYLCDTSDASTAKLNLNLIAKACASAASH